MRDLFNQNDYEHQFQCISTVNEYFVFNDGEWDCLTIHHFRDGIRVGDMLFSPELARRFAMELLKQADIMEEKYKEEQEKYDE